MRGTLLVNAARASSSAAGAAKPPSHATKSFLPNGQAPASTLRNLVDLHHTASTFMRDPSEIPTAFESAFRHHTPVFTTYEQFRASALRSVNERPMGGLERLAERGVSGVGARGALGGYVPGMNSGDSTGRLGLHDGVPPNGGEGPVGEAARLATDGFRPPRTWTYRRAPASAMLTEREVRVKEALFGTWERGQDAVPRPGLEGVIEIVQASGGSVSEAAKEWNARDGIENDSTEDGM